MNMETDHDLLCSLPEPPIEIGLDQNTMDDWRSILGYLRGKRLQKSGQLHDAPDGPEFCRQNNAHR